LHTNEALIVRADKVARPAGLRFLSGCPATNAERRTARRALIAFRRRLANLQPVTFTLEVTNATPEEPGDFPATWSMHGESLQSAWKDRRNMDLRLIAPPRTLSREPGLAVVETNRFHRWQRLHYPDPQWPQVIEARLDGVGGVVTSEASKTGGAAKKQIYQFFWRNRPLARWRRCLAAATSGWTEQRS
jgi:hypothetical protein